MAAEGERVGDEVSSTSIDSTSSYKCTICIVHMPVAHKGAKDAVVD